MSAHFFCCLSEEERNNIFNMPTYSSVLAMQGTNIQKSMAQVEDQGIQPCITGWCNQHHKVSVIAHTHFAQEYYKTPIEYYTHVMTLAQSI